MKDVATAPATRPEAAPGPSPGSGPGSNPAPADARAFAPLQPREASGDATPHELEGNPRFLVHHQFQSKFLPDPRDVLVYLPEAYGTSPDRQFPVFYLHDGQNLFDGRTSYVVNQTWRAHTTADTLTRDGRIEPLILVGVNNTGLRRMPEYTPTSDPRFRGGEGDRYGALLVGELKPLIDRSFRTRSGPEGTGLGGSSLGGLISLFLGLYYPEVFGRLAVLSPSVWWDNRSILRIVAEAHPLPRPRIWLDMGTSEGLRHLRDTDLLHHRLRSRGWRDGLDLNYLRVPGGLHTETAWADRFGEVLQFLFPVG